MSNSEETRLNIAVSFKLWVETQLTSLLFFLEPTCSVSPFHSLLVSVLSLSAAPHVFVFLYLTSCSLVSVLLFFCSTCPPFLEFSAHILHTTKPKFPLLPFLSFLPPPPHSLPFFPFLPLFLSLSLLLILTAFSLQQCSVWFDLSVCRAATPPCFHLTRAGEACRHFTTAHFQRRACFLESLCVPHHCLHYHISTILLSLTLFHNPLHADSGTAYIRYHGKTFSAFIEKFCSSGPYWVIFVLGIRR